MAQLYRQHVLKEQKQETVQILGLKSGAGADKPVGVG
jgi:hypothetical protein